MKMIGNVSDWLPYAGGALIKVADSAGSTVVHIRCCCAIKPNPKVSLCSLAPPQQMKKAVFRKFVCLH